MPACQASACHLLAYTSRFEQPWQQLAQITGVVTCLPSI